MVSVAIGILFGFATSLMLKWMRFLGHTAVTETFILISMGFGSYFVAEAVEILGLAMSGIISLLTCAII